MEGGLAVKKTWSLGLLVATAVAGLITLFLAVRSAAPWPEGTLVYLLPSLPESLDPARAGDEAAGRVLPLLFEGLVRYAPGSSALEPALASSWEVLDGGRIWVFRLRPGVLFHDGTPLTSDHVRASVARTVAGAAPASYATFVYGAVERIDTPDPLTVRFTLKRRYAPFPKHLAIPFAAPVSKLGADGVPVGTGPFVLREWVPGRRLVLAANPYYWDRRSGAEASGPGRPGPPGARPDFPSVDRLVFLAAGEPPRRALLKKAHIAEGVTPDAVPPGYRLHLTPRPDLAYLGFYVQKGPFADPRLRQAVAHALDRDLLARETCGGVVMPARGFLPPVLMDHAVSLPPHDPARAGRLLTAAGYPAGLDVTLITYREPRPYNPAGSRLAEAIAEQLGRVNIRVTVRSYPWQEYKAALFGQEGDFFLYGWTADSLDPDNFLQVLLATSQVPSGLNATRYSNRDVDALLARAQTTVDPAARRELYRLAHAIAGRDLPCLPLFHGLDRVAVSDRIRNFLPVWNRTAYLAGVGWNPVYTINEGPSEGAQ